MRVRWKISRRRVALVLLPLIALAIAAWTLATPSIGEPFAASEPSAAKLWSFGFVGDTQLGGEIPEQIFHHMRDAQVEFALHLGDMVDDPTCDTEWDSLMAAAARHRIRLMPVVGNHDRRQDYADRGEIGFRQYFPSLPGTFYHFRHRDVNFLMLNSERSFAPWSDQARFIRWQLNHQTGTTIACLHRPVFTSGNRDLANQLLRRVWLHTALKGGDTVAVLAGHHHYYDRTKPLDGISYVVSGGGSQKLYGAEKPKDITAVFHAGRNHYGLVDVYADRMKVRVLDLRGEELDQFELPLKPPASAAMLAHRSGTELPPLEKLPEYRAEQLEARMTATRCLPRPW
jgi:predicted phosphodiesterase